MSNKKIRALDIGRYGEEELRDGEQIIAFKHCGGPSWTVLVAPSEALRYLREDYTLFAGDVDTPPVLEPGEPDMPLDPHYTGGKSL